MFNWKVGRGSFSNLELLEAEVCPPLCAVCMWWERRVIMLSQVGHPCGVSQPHAGLEHINGVGGGIVYRRTHSTGTNVRNASVEDLCSKLEFTNQRASRGLDTPERRDLVNTIC